MHRFPSPQAHAKTQEKNSIASAQSSYKKKTPFARKEWVQSITVLVPAIHANAVRVSERASDAGTLRISQHQFA